MRPRRKRAEVDSALLAAIALVQSELDQNSTEELLALLEEFVAFLSARCPENKSKLFVELEQLAEQYGQRQLIWLAEKGLKFARLKTLMAFFVSQLFENLQRDYDPAIKGRLEKRRNHTYFTPPILAYHLAQSIFEGQDFSASFDFKILDVCSGSGALTMAALDYLSLLNKEPAKILADHFCAIEIDSQVGRLYDACLSIACGSLLKGKPIIADALLFDLPPCRFIVSNPPWNKDVYRLAGRAVALLEVKGVAALVAPAGLYHDQSAQLFREQVQGNWRSLEGFVNEDQAFPIHPSFKYAVAIIQKDAPLANTHVRFNLRAHSDLRLKNWHSQPADALANGRAFLECSNAAQAKFQNAVELAGRLYQLHEDNLPQKERGRHMQKPRLLPSSRFSVKFGRDFDMTLDAHLFMAHGQSDSKGNSYDCRIDKYGRLLQGQWFSAADSNSQFAAEVIFSADGGACIEPANVEKCYLPVIEGRMVSHFEIAAKGWISGSGRQALWHDSSKQRPLWLPQFFIADNYYKPRDSWRVGFVSVSSATNTRSMIAALLPAYPTGNSVPFLQVNSADSLYWALITAAVLNSLCFDYFLRTRFSGSNLNYYVLDQCAVPSILIQARAYGYQLSTEQQALLGEIADLSASLSFNHLSFAGAMHDYFSNRTALLCWLAPEERDSFIVIASEKETFLRARLDALVAKLYGFDTEQFAGLLNAEEHDQRGFERIDKNLPAAERLPVRAVMQLMEIEKLFEIEQKIEMEQKSRVELNSLQSWLDGSVNPETMARANRFLAQLKAHHLKSMSLHS